MASKKVEKKTPLTGPALLRSYLKTEDGKRSLVIPEDKAQEFVKAFLEDTEACDEQWDVKFMSTVFGQEEFEVEIQAKIQASLTVKVLANSATEAKKKAEALTTFENNLDHPTDIDVTQVDGRTSILSDVKATSAEQA